LIVSKTASKPVSEQDPKQYMKYEVQKRLSAEASGYLRDTQTIPLCRGICAV
jgi:hypothetical protein